MKKVIYLIIMALLFNGCKSKPNSVIEDVKNFQYKQNVHYSNKETSPLTDQDFISFSQLDFFAIDTTLVFKANFKRTPKEIPFNMLTTTSRLAKYIQYGVLDFKYKEKQHKLAVYQSVNPKSKEEEEELFIPFTDESNSNQTYKGGRYIDVSIHDIKENKILLNLNKNYNPYCAYNKKYSCPIPPKENHLDFEVNVGVKKFH